nr:MAG TPA: hypothetical protein [Caudoviricetes sp.]
MQGALWKGDTEELFISLDLIPGVLYNSSYFQINRR